MSPTAYEAEMGYCVFKIKYIRKSTLLYLMTADTPLANTNTLSSCNEKQVAIVDHLKERLNILFCRQ